LGNKRVWPPVLLPWRAKWLLCGQLLVWLQRSQFSLSAFALQRNARMGFCESLWRRSKTTRGCRRSAKSDQPGPMADSAAARALQPTPVH